MAKFHINPKTGNASSCRATKGNCPFGSEDEHFKTREDAQAHYEKLNESLTVSKKSKLPPKDISAYYREQEISVTRISKVPKTIVLSDVDGTLVRGSLVLDHAVWLHEKGIVNLGDSPAKWMADQKNEEHITELATAYKEAISGKTLAEIKTREYMNEVMSTEGKFYSSLERLKTARDEGHDVVLISGSPQFLIGDFAERFGFKGIGSTYHKNRQRRLNGRVTGMFFAEAKQQVIEKLEIEKYDMVVAYGDTASDKPLLEVAHHAVLVDPTPETLSRYSKVDEIIRD